MSEYGIFEDGFFEREAADSRAAIYRKDGEEHVYVHEICPEHPEQAREACEECDAEEKCDDDDEKEEIES